MAVAIAPHDTAHADADLEFPPTWLAATKVVALLVFLVAVVLALPALGILGLSSLLG